MHGLTSKSWMEGVTPELAFDHGLPITQALSEDRPKTKLLLFAELKRVWRSVRIGDGKTWQTDEDLQDAVDDIVDICRTMKVEEVLYVFRSIRRGERKLYGRLDTPTLIEALRDHDTNVTSALRERAHSRRDQPVFLPKKLVDDIMQTLPERRPTFEEVLKRGSMIPKEEREAMEARDRERRSNADATQTEGKT